MPKSLEELRSEMKAASDTMQSLKDVVASPDATAEALEQFDEASAKYDEAQNEFKEIQARTVDAEQRASRVKRAAEIADFQAKFDEDTIRNPNWVKGVSKAITKYDKEPENLQKDIGIALSAWAMGYEPSNIHPDAVSVCKRLGIAPSGKKFKPTALLAMEQEALFARVMAKRGGTYYSENFDSVTTYADSRDDNVLGLTNRAPTYVATIATNMVTYGGIMQAPITVETVQDYEDIIETYVSDIQSGRQIGEGRTIGTNINPTDGNLVWHNYDFTSDDMTVTERQLKRSRMDLPRWIQAQLGQRLGRILSSKFSNGTGANEPYGLIPSVTAGGKYVTSNTTNTIKYDDIHTGLYFAVDQMFRAGPGVGFMMSEPVLQLLMTLKDLEGRPMFNIGWEGQGHTRIPTLDGFPVYINREMITTYATTQKPILFGDFSFFKVVFRESPIPTLIRDETTSRRELKVIFTALINGDSRLQDYGNCPIAELRIL